MHDENHQNVKKELNQFLVHNQSIFGCTTNRRGSFDTGLTFMTLIHKYIDANLSAVNISKSLCVSNRSSVYKQCFKVKSFLHRAATLRHQRFHVMQRENVVANSWAFFLHQHKYGFRTFFSRFGTRNRNRRCITNYFNFCINISDMPNEKHFFGVLTFAHEVRQR